MLLDGRLRVYCFQVSQEWTNLFEDHQDPDIVDILEELLVFARLLSPEPDIFRHTQASAQQMLQKIYFAEDHHYGAHQLDCMIHSTEDRE
tara:strand:+ start:736 stop:1005 length:270 start_codon:yes stop_codon:yes gene_type:complete